MELAIRFEARIPHGVFSKRVQELDPALLGRIMSHAPHLLGAFGPKVRTMTAERQTALAEAWRDASERFPVHGAHLLRYLPDDDRRRLAFERFSLAARDRDGLIAPDLIAALPIELAAVEARRHVTDVTALAIDPVRRLSRIARYLPWTELETAMRRDKKTRGSMLRFVVLEDVGRPVRLEGPTDEQLHTAYAAVSG